tara:strand:+ start:305 stop:742 length:438 start_codon:yes stop_codon:yes gene_type:complete
MVSTDYTDYNYMNTDYTKYSEMKDQAVQAGLKPSITLNTEEITKPLVNQVQYMYTDFSADGDNFNKTVKKNSEAVLEYLVMAIVVLFSLYIIVHLPHHVLKGIPGIRDGSKVFLNALRKFIVAMIPPIIASVILFYFIYRVTSQL